MGRFQWLVGLAVIALLALVGVYTYNVGVARGLAQAGAFAAAAPGSGAPALAWWPRPWGVGFGFFPFAPLFFVLLWIVLLRGLFWHGGGGRWGRGRDGVPPAFDEWHRRAHQQGNSPSDMKG